MYVFIHIPKTAGSSFSSLLLKNFENSYLPLYQCRRGFLNDEDIRSISTIHANAECISSHSIRCPLPKSEEGGVQYNMLTFMRNPVEMTFSLYFYTRARIEKGYVQKAIDIYDFGQWLKDINEYSLQISNGEYTLMRNMQLTYLDRNCDVDAAKKRLSEDFFFIGVTERYEESLLILKNKMQKIGKSFDIVSISKNMTSNIIDYGEEKKKIKNRYRNMLEEWNQIDMELYAHANTILDGEIKKYDGDFEKDLAEYRKKMSYLKPIETYYRYKSKLALLLRYKFKLI